jgi:endonuclease/exonuclease/phosphatase family metal-dependent hydrolase
MKFITVLSFFLSLIIFSSVFISPELFPYVGLLPFLIPFVLIFNIILFIILALSLKKPAFLPLICSILGYKFFLITFQINSKNEDAEGLKVLTYNAHLFNYKKEPAGQTDPNIFSWISEHPADVKVIQEFYQDYTVQGRNALKILSNSGKMEYTYHVVEGNPKKRSYGLAIFSKYPIVNDGVVFDNRSNNGAIFSDIRAGRDTIRIYNVHLESMSIRTDSLDNYQEAKQIYRKTLGKLHRGSLKRAEQLNILREHVNNSPYPVILMGDLNEIPYSYTYFKLNERLKNAFELAGRGFGFTYNRILFFLRIDHIFSSPSLIPAYFNTHREVDYSDHFPVSATFTWEGMELL